MQEEPNYDGLNIAETPPIKSISEAEPYAVRGYVPGGIEWAFTTYNRYIQLEVFAPTVTVATGDGKRYFHIPPQLDGMKLVYVHARVITAGVTGTSDIQIANVTDSVDMLSTKLTIDTAETGSNTAATPAVVNPSNMIIQENDLLRIDIDAVSTTAPIGLIVTLGFRKL